MQLITDVGASGTVFSYSSYEKRILNSLSAKCPDLAESFNFVKSRLVDLLQLLRRSYYHPGFGGSYSIKKVLPVLNPSNGYKGLEIADGDSAVAMFAKMAKGGCSREMAERIRRDLLLYCEQDTLAMVDLFRSIYAKAFAE